jgi:hypothetical protein
MLRNARMERIEVMAINERAARGLVVGSMSNPALEDQPDFNSWVVQARTFWVCMLRQTERRPELSPHAWTLEVAQATMFHLLDREEALAPRDLVLLRLAMGKVEDMERIIGL